MSVLKFRDEATGEFISIPTIKGEDGKIQYTAGHGIKIENNVISTTDQAVELSSETSTNGDMIVKLLDEGGESLSEITIPIKERSIYYAEILSDNWYNAEVLQPILDQAYKNGYDDVFIKIKDGTRFITCSGMSLQSLTKTSNTTIMWANLRYVTGSSTNPNTIFYGYACANGVSLDNNGNVTITSTGLKNNSIRVMKDSNYITGYDATKTQVLKNVNGTLQWVSEN